MGRFARALIVLALVVVPATAAGAKSFWLTDAEVDIVVNEDGSLSVTERITFDFSGDYSGAYRDIPLGPGESIDDITVSDETVSYQTGACTELGCTSLPGTYGVEQNHDFVRIVWHHASINERRTFQIGYSMTGVTTAYEDVVDINLQVWGDQWAVGLDHLAAQMTLPAGANPGEVLVFGHPYGVDGRTDLGADQISPSLEASGISAYRWVEMRVVIPTSLLSSTAGATVVDGNGLDSIMEEEEQFASEASDAATAQRTGLILGAVFAVALSAGLGGLVYFGYGREPRVDYDREYEQEPPTELSPAEVGALLTQGGVTEKEFTATLFDLIRQGAIAATPSQVERSTWGGLRTETITDLVLSLTDKETGLRDFEQSVMTVVRRVLEDGPQPLHSFKEAIRDDAAANAKTYQSFRERVLGSIKRAGMLDERGNGVAWLAAIAVVLLIFGAVFLLPRIMRGRPGGGTIAVLTIVGMVIGAIALFVFLLFRRVRVRRTKEGAVEAERWDAFRRYLNDFSRLEEAPPISLDLWDRFLIYAIVFG
ncbi:MAG TPA: DUF2207 domain-containing protein, partial [Acidimicrobiia bacterium]|nr:DUF2207 domain-containing protein [Acidimicrobiia bacterium]